MLWYIYRPRAFADRSGYLVMSFRASDSAFSDYVRVINLCIIIIIITDNNLDYVKPAVIRDKQRYLIPILCILLHRVQKTEATVFSVL